MKTITISLPDAMKEFVEAQLAEEHFGTVSEYLRALIRDDQKRKAQQRLEELVLEGMDSGSFEMTDQHWDDLRRSIARVAGARKESRA